jgi:hypothetical protein
LPCGKIFSSYWKRAKVYEASRLATRLQVPKRPLAHPYTYKYIKITPNSNVTILFEGGLSVP